MNHMKMKISYLQAVEILFFKELLHFFQIFLEKKLLTIHVCSTALLYCFIRTKHCWILLLMDRITSKCWWGWSVICGSWYKQANYYFVLFLCINCTFLNMFLTNNIHDPQMMKSPTNVVNTIWKCPTLSILKLLFCYL